MSNFCQWVCLVHELRQCICSEERVNYRRNCFCINQINRSKYFIIANIHTLTNSTRHTSQTNSKLIRKLFADSTYTTVTQVVDIINICFRVNQLYQIFNDFNNILFCQHLDIHIRIQIQFFIDTVTAYLTQVITFFREEQVVNYLTCTCIIRRISITQLTVNIQHCFFFRVTWVFLQCVEYNRIIRRICIFIMNKDILYSRFNYQINMFSFNNCFTINNNLITFDRYNFTSVFIYEVFCPCFQYTSSQLTSNDFFQICLIYFDIFCKIENFKNIFIIFKTNSSQQSRNR